LRVEFRFEAKKDRSQRETDQDFGDAVLGRYAALSPLSNSLIKLDASHRSVCGGVQGDGIRRFGGESTALPFVPAKLHGISGRCDVQSGGATELVVRTIESAHATIGVAAYSFTSAPIVKALVAASKHGVDVRGVVNKSNATARYTAATFLTNQGVPVRVDHRYAIMHDKFVVVDGETVETGSFNFTSSAEMRNAENVIVLHDQAAAAQYQREWEHLWLESEELKARY
jgi:phosphatidylserine/phosphatidylglycerophosphate/cardiolipin synthase-like enzyme